MNFLEKLNLLMDNYNLNKNTLSQKSGIPYTTIDNWYKRGYDGVKLTTIKKLSVCFDTSSDFWIFDEITDPNYEKSSNFKINNEEMEYIKKYRSLDTHGQKTVQITTNRELERLSLLQEKDDYIAKLESYLAQSSALKLGKTVLENDKTNIKTEYAG